MLQLASGACFRPGAARRVGAGFPWPRTAALVVALRVPAEAVEIGSLAKFRNIIFLQFFGGLVLGSIDDDFCE